MQRTGSGSSGKAYEDGEIMNKKNRKRKEHRKSMKRGI